MYLYIIRPLLFLLDPEKSHRFIVRLLIFIVKRKILKRILEFLFKRKIRTLPRRIVNIDFPNPVGIAAGFDKNGEMIEALDMLGFGFIEIGTITPQPQTGNPFPRLFRLKEDYALINRMGFNNEGMLSITRRLKKRKKGAILGANIGKNKTTPNTSAINDYLQCFECLFEYVDYFTINVSSPNTPNLRELQRKKPIRKILLALQERNQKYPQSKPIFLKIAPDIGYSELDEILQVAIETHIQGIIATNTTIERNSSLKSNKSFLNHIGRGGLSGKPLSKRSTNIIRYIHQKSRGKLTIIGVGGIFSAEDAIEKIKAGASLVQIYTGFIYKGPKLIYEINQGLQTFSQMRKNELGKKINKKDFL